jgi:hypothetical protein
LNAARRRCSPRRIGADIVVLMLAPGFGTKVHSDIGIK